MPIVNSYINMNQTQPDGTLRVTEFHVDHIGNHHPHRYRARANADVDQNMADYAATLPDQLAVWELESAEVALENGTPPEDITLDHQNQRRFVRPLINVLMSANTTDALPLAKYVDANLNDAAIVAEFSAAVRDRVNARIAGLLPIEAALAADADKIERVR